MLTTAELGWRESSVVVDRKQLLDRLETNRAKHIAEYEAAVAGYKEQAHLALAEAVENAQKQLVRSAEKVAETIDNYDPDDETASDNLQLVPAINVKLVRPRSFVDAYDVAIEMTKADCREQLELEQGKFEAFWLDSWVWSRKFKAVSMAYMNNKR